MGQNFTKRSLRKSRADTRRAVTVKSGKLERIAAAVEQYDHYDLKTGEEI